MPPVTVRILTRRPIAVALDQVSSPQHRLKDCCLLPKTMGRLQLQHPIFEGWFLIRKPDFYIWWDCILAAQEEGYQTRVWTVLFFTHSVVVWCAAVVKQLQAPRASVPKQRWGANASRQCVRKALMVTLTLADADGALSLSSVQNILHAANPSVYLGLRGFVESPACCRHAGRIPIQIFPDSCCGSAHPPLLARPVRASRYTLPRACSPGRFIFLARPIHVEGQVSLCIVVGFYAQCLNFSSHPGGATQSEKSTSAFASHARLCVYEKKTISL
jgi:hypothetical protein